MPLKAALGRKGHRAGRHDEALKLLTATDDPVALLYRALAEYGRGRPDAAKAAREQAEKGMKMPDPQDSKQTAADRLTWPQRPEVEVLRRELQALLPASIEPTDRIRPKPEDHP